MSVEEFKKLYLPYSQKLYRIAFRLLENSFDAEDIVQEAYLKLWNKRDELGYVDNYESYCAVLVRNLCLDFLRARHNKYRQPVEDVHLADEALPLQQIEAKDELEYVKSIICQLPEPQKRVLELKHYEGYSNEEIETITGFSDVHVRVLLSRSRKKIRELFIKG